MQNKNVKKLYKELLSNEIDSKGFNFLKSTFQKRFSKKVPLDKIPQSWKKIYYKTYPRLSRISLKRTETKNNPLYLLLKNRKSERKFKKKTLSLKTISEILYFSSGKKVFNKRMNVKNFYRMYPSAGARYPLEVYPVILKSNEVAPGIYHYNVNSNCLELLLKGNFKKKFSKITGQRWVSNSGMIIIISAVFSRTITKYNERGWRYILFEAGHLAQNIQLISTALKLKSCPIGGLLDKEIIKFLDLNIKSEIPLYLISLGK